MAKQVIEELFIPTYIINLKKRDDRLRHIKSQFAGKEEFDITIVEACEHPIGAIGLWNSIVKVVEIANNNKEDVIIICEDDHEFTQHYSKNYLFQNILDAHDQGADLLLGGIGNFFDILFLTRNRCWISWFYCTQFTVIYRKFFEKIINKKFSASDTADGVFSEMTINKMVLHPFISVQKDFGYSDIDLSKQPKAVPRIFEMTSDRIERLKHILDKYGLVLRSK